MSLLVVEDLDVAYGDLRALTGVSLTVAEGETVALVGANGAGKSTLLGAVAGALRPSAGSIRLAGREVTARSPQARVAAGIALVPEGRRLFPSLSVRENLLVGGHPGRVRPADRPGPRWTVERVCALLPLVAACLGRPTATLSGGEQQAVAIGRALMSGPRLLLLDEVSLGLAPVVVEQLYDAVGTLRAAGTTIVLVEQDVGQALAVADRAYCLREGRVTLVGPTAELTREAVTAAYFGV